MVKQWRTKGELEAIPRAIYQAATFQDTDDIVAYTTVATVDADKLRPP